MLPSLLFDTSKLPIALTGTILSLVIVIDSIVFLTKVVPRKLEVALTLLSAFFIVLTFFIFWVTRVTPEGTIKSPPFS